MADFVHQLLPRGPDDKKPIALRLSSDSQARSGAGTQLDARDRDDNHTVFNAKLILATTGLQVAQFRHRHRPLEKAVDYAELVIYDEAQQEASMSDVTILGALPRKCLLLRLGDPTPSPLAREVREVSDQLRPGRLGCHNTFPSSSPNFCLIQSPQSRLRHVTYMRVTLMGILLSVPIALRQQASWGRAQRVAGHLC